MPSDTTRRRFLRNTLAASAGAALGFSHEEDALVAYAQAAAPAPAPESSGKGLPRGKIGDIEVSRLICGGNLISAIAHSRDLIYVSSLLKHYFTDEKVCETLKLVEAEGINTAILRYDDNTLRILNKYWHEHNGAIQWIVQVKPRREDLTTDIRKALEAGAVGAYIQGQVGDSFVKSGHLDLLGKAVEYTKTNGGIAGIGAHALEVIQKCEKAGFKPDFYMKTFHSHDYWSAAPEKQNDNLWEETPKETAEFMQSVSVPWIAFKVMAAGAIHPRDGFRHAYENGADFICAGMFDFQVKEDAEIARQILGGDLKRSRPWRA